MKKDYLKQLRDGEPLTRKQLCILILQLSVPAILAQISSIVMQYIDASMVGHLGSQESASIGLMASSTWLFGGLCMASGIGFNVQIAQAIGAKNDVKARQIVRLGIVVSLIFSVLLLVVGVWICGSLPGWLGSESALHADASAYFFIFSLFMPVMTLNYVCGGMLQSSGNMKTPAILHIAMCVLDVIFNAVLIFPDWTVEIADWTIAIPGFGLGVVGAALGTALAECVIVLLMLYFLLVRSPSLRLRHGERFESCNRLPILKKALKIAAPIGFEQAVMCGAQIASTRIVAPLGMASIAANSFSITAESLCYMPGYGIGVAATQTRMADDGSRHGRHGIHGGPDVRVCAANDCASESGSRDSGSGHDHSSHRSVCRTDVCSFDRCNRRISRGRRHTRSELHELRQHVVYPSAVGGTARP